MTFERCIYRVLVCEAHFFCQLLFWMHRPRLLIPIANAKPYSPTAIDSHVFRAGGSGSVAMGSGLREELVLAPLPADLDTFLADLARRGGASPRLDSLRREMERRLEKLPKASQPLHASLKSSPSNGVPLGAGTKNVKSKRRRSDADSDASAASSGVQDRGRDRNHEQKRPRLEKDKNQSLKSVPSVKGPLSGSAGRPPKSSSVKSDSHGSLGKMTNGHAPPQHRKARERDEGCSSINMKAQPEVIPGWAVTESVTTVRAFLCTYRRPSFEKMSILRGVCLG
jgi:hypothetical protein